MGDFINENVGLFYAKDKFENILLINEITEHNKDVDLICPICGTQVRPRAINSDKVSPHFYHVNATDHSSETVLHWWYKNAYIVKGDSFCVGGYKYICKEVLIEKAYNTSYGYYKPDVSIVTEQGETVFFEYNYTSRKNVTDYEEKWIELGCNVVEINIKDLLSMDVINFKPLFLDGIVVGAAKSKRYGLIEGYLKENNITDIMRIKYLNGFLRDLGRYQKGDMSIDDLTVIIDEMHEVDKIFIPKMLNRLKCQTILNQYAKSKRDKVIEYIIDKNKDIPSGEVCKNVLLRYRRNCIANGAKFNNVIQIGNHESEILFIKTNKILHDARFEISKFISEYRRNIEIEEYKRTERIKEEQILKAITYGKAICDSPYNLTVNYLKPFRNQRKTSSSYERVVSLEMTNDDKSWVTNTKSFENCYGDCDIEDEVDKIISKMKKRLQKKVDNFYEEKHRIEAQRKIFDENKKIKNNADATYDDVVRYFRNYGWKDFNVENNENVMLEFSKTRTLEIVGNSIIVTFGSRKLSAYVDNWTDVIKVIEKLNQ